MGLVQEDTTALTDAWKQTMDLVQQVLIGAGSWAWAFFSDWSPPQSSAQCLSEMRAICTAGEQWSMYDRATFVQWTLNNSSAPHKTSPLPQPDLDLAFFLTVRGPYFWLGYGWVGCSVPYDYPASLAVDYGSPTGTCSETAAGSGIFTRAWTKATSTVNCNSLQGSIYMLP